MVINLFSYQTGNSVLHKIPAGLKILFLISFSIFTFSGGIGNSLSEIFSYKFIIRISISFFVWFVSYIFLGPKNKIQTLKNISFVFVIGTFVVFFKILPAVINLCKTKSDLQFFYDSLASGILYFIRFFITTFFAELIFETTTQMQIVDAFFSLQNFFRKIFPPLKKINFALVISLAVTFIPEVVSEWNKISLAVRSRTIPKKSKNIFLICENIFLRIQALVSCLLKKAEVKRLAILNRGTI